MEWYGSNNVSIIIVCKIHKILGTNKKGAHWTCTVTLGSIP